MRIMIGNLPKDATEEGLRETLSGLAPVDAIRVFTEGAAPSAMIDMELTKLQADMLVKRIQGRIYKGCELRAWVPVMPWK